VVQVSPASPSIKIGPKVRLDVGGHKCTTSKATLLSERGSYLARFASELELHLGVGVVDKLRVVAESNFFSYRRVQESWLKP